jgi:hypothetical protein
VIVLGGNAAGLEDAVMDSAVTGARVLENEVAAARNSITLIGGLVVADGMVQLPVADLAGA